MVINVAARVAAVLFLAAGASALSLLPGDWAETTRANSAPVCSSDSTADCLRPVEGRVTDSRRSYGGVSVRYHFEPSEPAERDVWLRFADKVSAGSTIVLSGATVSALYWGDELYAFETPSGRVVPRGGDLDSRLNNLWVGIGMLAFAYSSWAFPRNRRYTGSKSYGDPLPPGVTIPMFVALGCMFGFFGAIFAGSIRQQVIVFACCLGAMAPLAAMSVWRWRRQA